LSGWKNDVLLLHSVFLCVEYFVDASNYLVSCLGSHVDDLVLLREPIRAEEKRSLCAYRRWDAAGWINVNKTGEGGLALSRRDENEGAEQHIGPHVLGNDGNLWYFVFVSQGGGGGGGGGGSSSGRHVKTVLLLAFPFVWTTCLGVFDGAENESVGAVLGVNAAAGERHVTVGERPRQLVDLS